MIINEALVNVLFKRIINNDNNSTNNYKYYLVLKLHFCHNSIEQISFPVDSLLSRQSSVYNAVMVSQLRCDLVSLDLKC